MKCPTPAGTLKEAYRTSDENSLTNFQAIHAGQNVDRVGAEHSQQPHVDLI